jgi:hypothetical protein
VLALVRKPRKGRRALLEVLPARCPDGRAADQLLKTFEPSAFQEEYGAKSVPALGNEP